MELWNFGWEEILKLIPFHGHGQIPDPRVLQVLSSLALDASTAFLGILCQALPTFPWFISPQHLDNPWDHCGSSHDFPRLIFSFGKHNPRLW